MLPEKAKADALYIAWDLAHKLAMSADHAARAAMYESQKIFKEAKKFDAARKELAAKGKPE
jgi:hypothetical protein